MGSREQTGGFELKKAGDCGVTKCTAILQERDSDQFARIVIGVDPAKPHAIKEVEFRAISRPADFPITRMTEAEALKAFRAYLGQAAAAGCFSGAALVAKNGKQVFTSVYGLADRNKKIPNHPGTQFRVGSMNKMFTATAVLQLVQAGKLNLSDPLGKYLPDYPNKTWPPKSPFATFSLTPEAPATSSGPSSTSTAWSCARCRITSSFTESGVWPSSPAAAGLST
jgi:D-alanyl-D-alanine carboxypeptidase